MLETIRELKHRNPFVPFRIITTSGDRYDVTDPDAMALLDSQIFIAHPRSDRWTFIRLNQIVTVEIESAAA